MNTDRPFVLLDDARGEAASPARLYRAPIEIITATLAEEVRPALARLREVRQDGLHAAGYLAYEAGAALEPRLAGLVRDPGMPLLWFGLFERFESIAPDAVAGLLPDPAGAWAGAPEPRIGRVAYDAALAKAHRLIAAGDIYQANVTFAAAVSCAGDARALYAAIRGRARAGYGGLIWTGSDWFLSFSPELFFALRGKRLTARPMKGTARRHGDDAGEVEALRDDPKQRAENLMIVDLMRNDLSRVAQAGSVSVPALFAIESYPTVHQMVSTITAELAGEHDALTVLATLFPCGSITGAPKIRAMEVIHAIEPLPRGIYTGAIGRLDADGDAAFNVAIRTLHLRAGADTATLGLGSGIVADSQSAAEWDESLAKGSFIAAGQRRFDLIETMAFDPLEGLLRLDLHIARIAASADRFGFVFDRHAARNELQAATFALRKAARVRLVLAASGAMVIETAPVPSVSELPVPVRIVPLPVEASDFRLRHKTSDRRFYDRMRGDAFEVIFERPDGKLTEGSFTNLFVPRDGRLVTPPLARGLLPGILRRALIECGRALEGEVTARDLANSFFIGNAVRGLIPARLDSAPAGR